MSKSKTTRPFFCPGLFGVSPLLALLAGVTISSLMGCPKPRDVSRPVRALFAQGRYLEVYTTCHRWTLKKTTPSQRLSCLRLAPPALFLAGREAEAWDMARRVCAKLRMTESYVTDLGVLLFQALERSGQPTHVAGPKLARGVAGFVSACRASPREVLAAIHKRVGSGRSSPRPR